MRRNSNEIDISDEADTVINDNVFHSNTSLYCRYRYFIWIASYFILVLWKGRPPRKPQKEGGEKVYSGILHDFIFDPFPN